MKRTKIIKAIQKALQGMTPMDKDDISTEDELNITDPLYKIELETGILINPFILPKKIWGKVVTPFYENVMKEGVALL